MQNDLIVKVSMDGQLTDEVAHFEYEGVGESKGVIDFVLKTFRPYRFENLQATGKPLVPSRMQLHRLTPNYVHCRR